MNPIRYAIAIIALASLTAACGGAGSAPDDPYGVYVATNPDPGLVLSREDAQLRAILGCGQRWAPGTVDAALSAAYKPEC